MRAVLEDIQGARNTQMFLRRGPAPRVRRGDAALLQRAAAAAAPDVEGEVERVEQPVRGGGRHHEARVDGAADDAAQGVPGPVIEPVVEVVKALGREVLGGAKVEVGVELVDHGLEAQHGEQPGEERCTGRVRSRSARRRRGGGSRAHR